MVVFLGDLLIGDTSKQRIKIRHYIQPEDSPGLSSLQTMYVKRVLIMLVCAMIKKRRRNTIHEALRHSYSTSLFGTGEDGTFY